MTAALGFVLGYGVLTVVAFTLSVALCDGPALETDSGNIFTQVANFLTFQGCNDLPSWFGWLLFVVFTFPWIVFLLYLIAPVLAGVAANPIAGTILALATIATIVTVFVTYIE